MQSHFAINIIPYNVGLLKFSVDHSRQLTS